MPDSIYGFLDPVTGEIGDINSRSGVGPGPNDVELLQVPTFVGPYSYDAVNKLAVASATIATAKLRTAALAMLADQNASDKALRALGLVLIDYANTIGTKHNALLTWLGAETTLTNRAALTGFQLPTNLAISDLKTAITTHINAGDAD
jgi:hypothetical protein